MDSASCVYIASCVSRDLRHCRPGLPQWHFKGCMHVLNSVVSDNEEEEHLRVQKNEEDRWEAALLLAVSMEEFALCRLLIVSLKLSCGSASSVLLPRRQRVDMFSWALLRQKNGLILSREENLTQHGIPENVNSPQSL